MSRRRHARPACAAPVLVLVLGIAGCGGGSKKHSLPRTTASTRPTTNQTAARPTSSGAPEVLGVPAVGRFYARCPRGAGRWTVRFVAEPGSASDEILVLSGPGAHRVQVDPGAAASWALRPRTVILREPADPQSHTPAASVRATAPLHLVIEQGTEPHTFRVEVRLALTSAQGGAAACAPVDTQIGAATYFNGGGP